MAGDGGVARLITLLVVAVQPFAAVTLTEYVLAANIVVDCAVAPFDQRKAVYPALSAMSVREPPGQTAEAPEISGFGAGKNEVPAPLVAAQPFALVTVTAKEPVVLTLMVGVVAPVDHK